MFSFGLRIPRMSASTAGWIAVAAAVLAVLGLAAWAWTLVLLRRARAAQKVLLGGGKRDIVDFAVSLQGRIDDVLRSVDEIAAGLSRVDRRVDGPRAPPPARRPAARPARRRRRGSHVDRALRRPLGRGRPPVGVPGDARLVAHGGRHLGDPGPRL